MVMGARIKGTGVLSIACWSACWAVCISHYSTLPAPTPIFTHVHTLVYVLCWAVYASYINPPLIFTPAHTYFMRMLGGVHLPHTHTPLHTYSHLPHARAGRCTPPT